jgi:hypothetical protein
MQIIFNHTQQINIVNLLSIQFQIFVLDDYSARRHRDCLVDRMINQPDYLIDSTVLQNHFHQQSHFPVNFLLPIALFDHSLYQPHKQCPTDRQPLLEDTRGVNRKQTDPIS